MNKHLFTALLVLGFPGLQAYGITFHEALSGGYISFSATAHSGYSETRLVISTTQSVSVDFSSVCFYQSNSSQRVGLTKETSTGNYYLDFPENYSGTLIFESRCLDRNRPAPTTGVSYDYYVSIPSQFDTLINALRSNASQGEIWSITDEGSLAAAWKSADPRVNGAELPPTPDLRREGNRGAEKGKSYRSTRRYRVPRGWVYTSKALPEYTGRYTRRDLRKSPRGVRLR